MTWTGSLFRAGSLSVGVSWVDADDDRQTIATLLVSIPIGARDYAGSSLQYIREDDSLNAVVDFGRNLLVSDSFGYGVRVEDSDGTNNWMASSAYQSRFGEFGVELDESFGTLSARAYARGGVVAAGGAVAASRHVDSGFVIVNVADFADVQLYANNQPTVRTNASG